MQLAIEDYYTRDADIAFMSCTQFKRFDECEAAAMAILLGQYREESTTAQLVGSYVDAFFNDDLDGFKAIHPELFKKDGSLKSEFVQADQIIDRICRDDMMRKYLAGQHQIVKTGTIAGIPFKIRMDSYFPGSVIVDLKVMRDFKPVWKDGYKRSFIEAWGYDLQGAIYQAVEGAKLPFVIAAATKEAVTDIALLSISDHHLAECLETVKSKAPRFDAIKRGAIPPDRCEICDYCKQTKIITEVIDYELIGYYGEQTEQGE